MVKGKTSSGFEFEVNERKLDSWDFVKAVRNLHRGDEYAVDVAEAILGEAQMLKLEKSLIKDGVILAEDMGNEIAEIIEACQPAKNS